MSTWQIVDTSCNEIIDTVYGYEGCDSEYVTESEQCEYEENIHAIRDDKQTAMLSELENNDGCAIENTEHLYLIAIECGFLNRETLETYEEII